MLHRNSVSMACTCMLAQSYISLLTSPAGCLLLCLLQFFIDTEFELQQQRPDGFPASGIWAYRVANVALNLLNYFWFCKLASKAVQQLIGGDKEKEKNKSHAGKMG